MVVLESGIHVVGLVSLDETGVQVVDTDSVRSPFSGEAAGQVGNGTLGGVVEDLGDRGVDNGVGHGGDYDDRTCLLPLDPEVGSGLSSVEYSQDVNIEDLLEVLGSEFESGLDD